MFKIRAHRSLRYFPLLATLTAATVYGSVAVAVALGIKGPAKETTTDPRISAKLALLQTPHTVSWDSYDNFLDKAGISFEQITDLLDASDINHEDFAPDKDGIELIFQNPSETKPQSSEIAQDIKIPLRFIESETEKSLADFEMVLHVAARTDDSFLKEYSSIINEYLDDNGFKKKITPGGGDVYQLSRLENYSINFSTYDNYITSDISIASINRMIKAGLEKELAELPRAKGGLSAEIDADHKSFGFLPLTADVSALHSFRYVISLGSETRKVSRTIYFELTVGKYEVSNDAKDNQSTINDFITASDEAGNVSIQAGEYINYYLDAFSDSRFPDLSSQPHLRSFYATLTQLAPHFFPNKEHLLWVYLSSNHYLNFEHISNEHPTESVKFKNVRVTLLNNRKHKLYDTNGANTMAFQMRYSLGEGSTQAIRYVRYNFSVGVG